MNNTKERETENYNFLFKPSEKIRDLHFLEEIELNPNISQRELSQKFGIALGITNACIKRMVGKGLIKLKGIPPRRIAYYLTPKGFSEKAKLTLRFFSYNIHHYSEMKRRIGERLIQLQNSGVKRVAFYGITEEMEVAYVTCQGLDLKLVGIVDEEKNLGKKIFGYKVITPKGIKALNPDAILITSLKDQNSYIKNLSKQKDCNGIKLVTV